MSAIDWPNVVKQLCSFPSHTQKLHPPCAQERITEEERRLGRMPSELAEMLRAFNGGKLFIKSSPLITLFGLSFDTDPANFDWFIDRFTPSWRSALGQTTDWVIGMTNYGGIVVLGCDLLVSEWDTNERDWTAEPYSLNDWVEKLMEDGAAYLNEA